MDMNTSVLYCACMYVTIAILYGVLQLDYKYSRDLPCGMLRDLSKFHECTIRQISSYFSTIKILRY